MKKTIVPCLLAILATLGIFSPGWALELKGNPVQGGLVIGRAEPGTRVFLGERPLRISPEGLFAFGFGRDAPPTALLRIRRPSGETVLKPLIVEKRTYEIERIDGLPPRKVAPSPGDLARIREEIALVKQARSWDAPRTDFAMDFIWPVTGRISGVYGSRRVLNGKPKRPHYGVDIAAPAGTPVRAPADGVVTLVHPDMFYSGGTLILDHGHGVSSTFLHLRTALAREGQFIRRGAVMAEVGATGRATGPHLDWRINWFDRRLDPALLVPPMGGGKGGKAGS